MEAMILKVAVQTSYHTYNEAMEDLTKQGVKHLGWLNAGINVPEGNYERVYKNGSGSSTLMCDISKRLSYSVDMGD